MSRIISAAFHALAAGTMLWGFNSLHTTILDSWIRNQTGGHFQFLTIQGLFVAIFTMITSLACDIAPALDSIKRVKRALLMIGLPLAVTISTIYWPLVLFLPHMIMQKGSVIEEPSSQLPEFIGIPLSMDLALHAVPALSLLLDFFAFEMPYFDLGAAVKLMVAFTLWYATWVEYCGASNGTFPYPFLTENELSGRMLIYCGASLLSLCSFYAINAVHKSMRPSLAQKDKQL